MDSQARAIAALPATVQRWVIPAAATTESSAQPTCEHCPTRFGLIRRNCPTQSVATPGPPTPLLRRAADSAAGTHAFARTRASGSSLPNVALRPNAGAPSTTNPPPLKSRKVAPKPQRRMLAIVA